MTGISGTAVVSAIEIRIMRLSVSPVFTAISCILPEALPRVVFREICSSMRSRVVRKTAVPVIIKNSSQRSSRRREKKRYKPKKKFPMVSVLGYRILRFVFSEDDKQDVCKDPERQSEDNGKDNTPHKVLEQVFLYPQQGDPLMVCDPGNAFPQHPATGDVA